MGNYLKFSRIMSQTPWKVDDKMLVLRFLISLRIHLIHCKYESSIQEEIAKVINLYFKANTYKFHSGVLLLKGESSLREFLKGREDIDVRMLGLGRPFVLELIDPKRALSVKAPLLKEMEGRINESNDVIAFCFFSKVRER